MHSVAAEEASAPAEEEVGGNISEQERAQYERWAAEVAVRSPSSSLQSVLLLGMSCLVSGGQHSPHAQWSINCSLPR